MRSGILFGVMLMLAGCGPCVHSCPINFELTLSLADHAGHPLTPETVVVSDFPDVTLTCGNGVTCAENRLTVRVYRRTPHVRAVAFTGQVFDGDLAPDWTESAPKACSCPVTTASANVTLQ